MNTTATSRDEDRRDPLTKALDDGSIRCSYVNGRPVIDSRIMDRLASITSGAKNTPVHTFQG